MDQQRSQIGVATFTDTQQLHAATAAGVPGGLPRSARRRAIEGTYCLRPGFAKLAAKLMTASKRRSEGAFLEVDSDPFSMRWRLVTVPGRTGIRVGGVRLSDYSSGAPVIAENSAFACSLDIAEGLHSRSCGRHKGQPSSCILMGVAPVRVL